VLDRQRLGKQRVEVLQIHNALTGQSKGWTNHPATRMWRGYEPSLVRYGIAMCYQWKARGYNDTLLPRFIAMLNEYREAGHPNQYIHPSWLYRQEIIDSHRSNLIRKMPEHYGKLWRVADDLPYIWPVSA
jgi:hypothetical protein